MTDHPADPLHNDSDTLQIERYPVEQRAALAVFVNSFPEASDLLYSNPPLAVAMANARAWDTFGLTTVDHPFICSLLRQRRRKICAALGFPSCERVVRILNKVQPQACSVHLLDRIRGALRNPALLAILSHLPFIGAPELNVAADLGDCPNISVGLFTDLVMHFTRESAGEWRKLLKQTANLLQPPRDECRMFGWAIPSRFEAFLHRRHPHGHRLRSVQQVRRSHYRLWCDLVDLESFDPAHDYADFDDILFPSTPLPGIDAIRPINTGGALVEEARSMGHCVLRYAERVAEGKSYLYRVLNPERATLLIAYRITDWCIEELAGVRNQAVSPATKEVVESWLRTTQILIRHD